MGEVGVSFPASSIITPQWKVTTKEEDSFAKLPNLGQLNLNAPDLIAGALIRPNLAAPN